jgi:hypothetical protein
MGNSLTINSFESAFGVLVRVWGAPVSVDPGGWGA